MQLLDDAADPVLFNRVYDTVEEWVAALQAAHVLGLGCFATNVVVCHDGIHIPQWLIGFTNNPTHVDPDDFYDGDDDDGDEAPRDNVVVPIDAVSRRRIPVKEQTA